MAMLIFDAHLDLAMNAIEWNRDFTRPIDEIRRREEHLIDKPDRGRGTVCFSEMRKGGIGLCVATQIGRHVKPGNALAGWHSPEQAWAMTQGQLSWYRAMEEKGEMRQLRNLAQLNNHVAEWTKQPGANASVGYILSLEGADSLVNLTHLERSFEQGLRALGPAHYGPGAYAQGTHVTGGFPSCGRALLKEMERLNIILDVTHLSEECFWEALDLFGGHIWASHSNCRALVPDQRQFSDEQIKSLIDRGAVIGAVLDAWMMVPGWVRGKTRPEQAGLKLERLVDHIDHICQLAGNTAHSGIGSDLDGAFGREQCPEDLNTIADLGRLPEMLARRGYKDGEINGIMSGNFINFLKRAWTA